MTKPIVWLLATCDTKGVEADYLLKALRARGVNALLVDTGSLGPPTVRPDVDRAAVLAVLGVEAAAASVSDRGQCVDRMAAAVRAFVLAAHARHEVAGVIGIGGSAGTIIGTEAMRALPLGIPKVMVSTIASGQTRPYVGTRDIFMLNAVADISGLNIVSRTVLDQAAAAMAGLVQSAPAAVEPRSSKGRIALTMFGVTTPCIEHARTLVEAAGYETIVLHATGQGGMVFEDLVRDGFLVGVLDLTTTELADECVGGFLSAGPTRLSAAAETGLPQVVSFGATDMVNFYGLSSVPEKFVARRLHAHNREVTLMRTSADECRRIGADIGNKLARSQGPVVVLWPARGVSSLDIAGGVFDDPDARKALLTGFKQAAPGIRIEEVDLHINDSAFAQLAVQRLLALLPAPSQGKTS